MIFNKLLVVCCKCRRYIKTKDCEEYEAEEFRVSHSYCEDCAKEEMAKLPTNLCNCG